VVTHRAGPPFGLAGVVTELVTERRLRAGTEGHERARTVPIHGTGRHGEERREASGYGRARSSSPPSDTTFSQVSGLVTVVTACLC
jgi:hypothetical protein